MESKNETLVGFRVEWCRDGDSKYRDYNGTDEKTHQAAKDFALDMMYGNYFNVSIMNVYRGSGSRSASKSRAEELFHM
jgi:hypothetical protein